jgi:hypothetical protein
MRKAICVSGQSSNDWALLVSAVHEFGERRISPMIWISGSSLITAKMPKLELWRHLGLVRIVRDAHFTPEQRSTMLAGLVKGAADDVRENYRDFYLYKEAPGVLTNAVLKVIGRYKSLPNFSVSEEPAYEWFIAHEELAARAHQYLRYLALGDSGSFPAVTKLTFDERAKLEEQQLLGNGRGGARAVGGYSDVRDSGLPTWRQPTSAGPPASPSPLALPNTKKKGSILEP